MGAGLGTGEQLGSYGEALATVETQFTDPTIGLFGLMLVTQEQFALIMIAVLIMVFQESSYGVIRYLEYAYRLPESCKRDPEYCLLYTSPSPRD